LLQNVAEQVYGTHTAVGGIDGTGITIMQVSAGAVKLAFHYDIPQGKKWSGVITVLKFQAAATGTTAINVE